MKAIIYIRVSTDEQAENGRSLDKQLEECRLYATRHNFRVIAELQDDYTGTVPLESRPKGQVVYEKLRAGEADALIVYSMDRLVRPPDEGDEWDIAILIRGLAKLKKEIHRTDKGKIGTSFADLLIAVLDAKSAGDERRESIKRLTIGRVQKARAGFVVGTGPVPYGYRYVLKEGKKVGVEEFPERAKIIRQIYHWYVQERVGIYQIAKRLNARRVITPLQSHQSKRKVKHVYEWTGAAVYRILTSECYVGRWRYGRERYDTHTRRVLPNGKEYRGKTIVNPADYQVDIPIPALIDEETWRQAQQLRQANKKYARRNAKVDYTLRGRVHCACGSGMSGYTDRQPEKEYRYYACSRMRQNCSLISKCQQPRLPAEKLELSVWEYLRSAIEQPDRFGATLQKWQASADSTETARLEELELAREEEREARAAIDDITALAGKARGYAKESAAVQLEQATQRHEHALKKIEEKEKALSDQNLIVDRINFLKQRREEVLAAFEEPTCENMEYVFRMLNVSVMAEGKKCQIFSALPVEPGTIEFDVIGAIELNPEAGLWFSPPFLVLRSPVLSF